MLEVAITSPPAQWKPRPKASLVLKLLESVIGKVSPDALEGGESSGEGFGLKGLIMRVFESGGNKVGWRFS